MKISLRKSYVLGSSQTRKWASFTLTVNDNGVATLWDAENGDHYELEDNRCALISVSRLINSQNVSKFSDRLYAFIISNF